MRSKLSLGLLFAAIIAVFALMINYISQIVVSNGVNEIELRDAEADMKELHSLLNVITIRFRAFLEKVKKKYRNSQRNRVPWDYEKKIS